MNKLVLIDGNALLYRAFHAYPPFVTPSGELVGAVYGFTTLLLSVIEKLGPTHVAVTWDVKAPTFRKKRYSEYKAQRAPMDENLVVQIGRTKEVVKALNIPQFEEEGYEADDIVGTISKKIVLESDSQVVIVTGDRDALQLVEGKKIVVYLPIQNKYAKSLVFDEDKVMENYEIKPKQIVDLKGLMGDSSDNIPGVSGIGKVTATKLIKEFGTIENMYKLIDDVDSVSPRIKKMLLEGKDMAIMSRDLAEIFCQVPIQVDLEKCLLADYDRQEVVKLFDDLGFKSLIDRLPEQNMEKEIVDIFI